jgi:N-acetylmuramic acid 6-phosphate (MurNAc-6-P) etherase
MYASGCSEEEAVGAFEKTGGNAKAAILMLIGNTDSSEAKEYIMDEMTCRRGCKG